MADQSNFGGTTACDLGNWLLQYGVDSSLYGSGTAKSLDALLGEVSQMPTLKLSLIISFLQEHITQLSCESGKGV